MPSLSSWNFGKISTLNKPVIIMRIPLGILSLSLSQGGVGGLPLVLEKFAFPQVLQFKDESDFPDLPQLRSTSQI